MGMQHISTGLAGLQDEPDREDGGAYEEAYLVGAVGLRAEGAQGEQLEGPLEAALRRRGGGELAERAVGGVEQAVVRAQARVPGRGRERDDLQDGDMLAGASSPTNGMNAIGGACSKFTRFCTHCTEHGICGEK